MGKTEIKLIAIFKRYFATYKKMHYKFAFSLVEILVALIIISLITAAMAPAITKKLSSSSITIAGGGSGSGATVETPPANPCAGKQCNVGYYANSWDGCACTPCSTSFCRRCENDTCTLCSDGYDLINGQCVGGTQSCRESNGKPTQACCESVGAVYLPKAATGLASDLCMMKYNAFDGAIKGVEAAEIFVKLVNINNVCSTNSCCWSATDTAKSATDCTIGANGDSQYSGCTRTLCQATAATKICNNWAPLNYAPGAWRLPTQSELMTLKDHVATFSLNQGSNGLQLCDSSSSSKGADKCSQKSGSGGNACAVSASEANEKDDCRAYGIWGQSNSYLYLSNGAASVGTENEYYNPKGVRCVTTNVDSGTLYTHNIDTSIGEPLNQADCDKFNALFISAQYNGNPYNRNICITKFNVFDNGGPFYPYDSSIAKIGVKLTAINSVCNVKSCCWKGVSAGAYTDGLSYGGSSRTLCQFPSAQALCVNWNPEGSYKGAWRLPFQAELEAIAPYLSNETGNSYFLNLYLNAAGLQLCDASSSTGVDKCAQYSGQGNTACAVSSGEMNEQDDCRAYAIWGQNNSFMSLSSGSASVSTENQFFHPKSVRCVTDAIIKTSVADQTVDGLSDDKVREYQAICDKYNALFIPKKYLGTSKNICMSKYNAFDANGPLENATDEELAQFSPAVKRVKINSICNTGYCCWYDGVSAGEYTTGHNSDSIYSGGTRALCQATAASVICENYMPDSMSKGSWRLPTYTELQNLAIFMNFETQYSSFLNLYAGKSGLQLCDSSSSTGIDKCSQKSGSGGNACAVSASEANEKDDCQAFKIWGQGNTFLQMTGGTASTGTETSALYNPKSVRCVTEIGVN